MPGLVPGIHAERLRQLHEGVSRRASCFLTQRLGVDGRDKPGHDGFKVN